MGDTWLSPTTAASDDPLLVVLHHLVYRDLLDATVYLAEPIGWTPITVAYAQRIRALNAQIGLWDDEPALVRDILDGP